MLKIQNQFQAKMPEISDDSSPSGNDGSRSETSTAQTRRDQQSSINGGGWRFAATRAIRQRLKPSNLVIVRDAQIPLSSAHEELQPHLSAKRRVIALNEKMSSSLMASAALSSSRAAQLGSNTTAKHGSNKAAQLAAPKQSSSAAAKLSSTPAQQKQGNPARQQRSSLSARWHALSKFVMKLVEEDASNQHNMMMLNHYREHTYCSEKPVVSSHGQLRAEAFNRPRSITEPFGGLKNLPMKLSMRSELQEHELRATEFKSTSCRAHKHDAELGQDLLSWVEHELQSSNTSCRGRVRSAGVEHEAQNSSTSCRGQTLNCQGQPRAAKAEHEVQNLNTRCRGRA
ncbi:hypothetical protein SLEP1_g51118 [Rubroshorea leprosula]|uniref:Uncharacterized protein n=1 Tax=Rubroshorea leprosula TaxID=152421 RepID=A0AAV5M248_9ROSI|nr:hypothetical protein SLEP1_g51118 [Rubroshorea leprosula]